MGLYGRHNNCMSYALERSKWTLPKGWEKYANNPSTSNYNYMIRMLHTTYPLKAVTRDEMVLGKRYVAFRLSFYDDGIPSDFHFVRREPSGHWTHKRGWNKPQGISEKLVFSKKWEFSNEVYDGSLYLFEYLG